MEVIAAGLQRPWYGIAWLGMAWQGLYRQRQQRSRLTGAPPSMLHVPVIGTRSSSLELASLGPATVLCDSLIYCISFLAVATTNLQATALANNDLAEAQKVFEHMA